MQKIKDKNQASSFGMWLVVIVIGFLVGVGLARMVCVDREDIAQPIAQFSIEKLGPAAVGTQEYEFYKAYLYGKYVNDVCLDEKQVKDQVR